MEYDPGLDSRIHNAALRVLHGKSKYQSVEDQIKMPWYMIGALHNMEASCSFEGVLHNGEKIIGTGRKTVLVPKGRGPFRSWEEAAIDALSIKNYKRFAGLWDIGFMLQRAEMFNGTGYLKYHPDENTPYLWACTSINDGKGKYVADGKWNPNADANGQVGVAAIFKELEKIGEIKIPLNV